MTTLAHIGLWTERLETLRDFYAAYFGGRYGKKYSNPATGFESYMLSFGDGCRLELMRRPDVSATPAAGQFTPQRGLAHMAFACENEEKVRILTERLRADGYRIVGEPRITGDGYFESVVADPDGNPVEITC